MTIRETSACRPQYDARTEKMMAERPPIALGAVERALPDRRGRVAGLRHRVASDEEALTRRSCTE